MSKQCGHTVPCGCGDKALTTAPSCNEEGSCASSEECAEKFSNCCIVHTGEDYEADFSGGSNKFFRVRKGERLDLIIQKLMTSWLEGDGAFKAAVGIKITNINPTGFTVTWEGLDSEVYTIDAEHQNPTSSNLEVIPQGVYTYKYDYLISGDTYRITITTAGGVKSVTFIVTLP